MSCNKKTFFFNFYWFLFDPLTKLLQLSNGYGQPPMKRQVMDTSSMNLISPGQSQLGQASQQATSLSTLYGGNTFNALSQQPAFYQPQTSGNLQLWFFFLPDLIFVCNVLISLRGANLNFTAKIQTKILFLHLIKRTS